MIKFGGRTGDGSAVVGLALSRRNLERLEGGEPISIRGDAVGAPGVVVFVVAGETAELALEQFKAAARAVGAEERNLEQAIAEANFDTEKRGKP